MTQQDELTKDPLSVIAFQLNSLKKADPTLDIPDPNNGFMFLLEANASIGTSLGMEAINLMEDLYPTLGLNAKNLYKNISENEMFNVFALPVENKVKFLINEFDLLRSGVKLDNGSCVCTIPAETTINVDGLVFTLLNDINITLMSNGGIFANQELSNSSLGYNETGVLPTQMITDVHELKWLVVETDVKQLEIEEFTETLSTATIFKKIYDLKEDFHAVEIFMEQNNIVTKMKTTFSSNVYDINDPTAIIEAIDKSVSVYIPDIYMFNTNTTNVKVKIKFFTTKGPVEKVFSDNTDNYILTIGPNEKTPAMEATNRIGIKALANINISGGKKKKTIEELRTSIINNTVKTINVPINEYELDENARNKGFKLKKVLDIVTSRIYTASKNFSFKNDDMSVRADVFIMNTTNTITELKDNPFIFSNDSHFVIKPNSIFKLENGIVKLITSEETNLLNSKTGKELVNFIGDSKYFFNPYYYIVSKKDKVINSRVYDLQNPHINTILINKRVKEVSAIANIINTEVIKKNSGYSILLQFSGNDAFDNLSLESVKGILYIPIFNSKEILKITNTMFNNNVMSFDLLTDFVIDEKHSLNVLNANALETFSIALTNEIKLYLYTTDLTVNTSGNNELNDEVPTVTSKEVFVKQSMRLNLGKELPYIWNKVSTMYTDRKFKKRTEDIPLKYTDNIYEAFPDGSYYRVKADNSGVEYNLKHSKGSIVKDLDGNDVFKYKKGDPLLDEQGVPILDTDGGIIRNIAVLLIEMEFLKATDSLEKTYLSNLIKSLTNIIDADMTNLNRQTLDNTEILYKTYRDNSNIEIIMDDDKFHTPFLIKPVFEIAINKQTMMNTEIKRTFLDICNKLLHDFLQQDVIALDKLNAEIKDKLGNDIIYVRCKNIIPDKDLEYIKLADNSNRFTIAKKSIVENGKIKTAYDSEINIITI